MMGNEVREEENVRVMTCSSLWFAGCGCRRSCVGGIERKK